MDNECEVTRVDRTGLQLRKAAWLIEELREILIILHEKHGPDYEKSEEGKAFMRRIRRAVAG